ncbi:MAG: glycosyltransferase [Tissierellales bacterium]|nr:glycosyltransferase [Tissierellales bacterium]MBN2828270.1 glycosyltransferase [Tissierellales bacterium]
MTRDKKRDYCSIYVRNQDVGASSYYRIMQYIHLIEGHFKINNSMNVNEYRYNLNLEGPVKKRMFQAWCYALMLYRMSRCVIRDIILRPRCVILERTFLPLYSPRWFNRLLSILGTRTSIYWDFDDDIFMEGEIPKRQGEVLMKITKKIVVTNAYLKCYIHKIHQDKVYLLPTTDGDFRNINRNSVNRDRRCSFDNEIKLVWVATGSNMLHLERVLPYLDFAAEKILLKIKKKLVLTVVCNKSITCHVNSLSVLNISWTREAARQAILTAHVGIMPLNDIPYALGKGGFKLIQYISTGLPVIASNVGYNKKVVDESCGCLIDHQDTSQDWLEAIEKLTNSWEDWERFSEGAYEKWNREFSFDKNLEFWDAAIKEAM